MILSHRHRFIYLKSSKTASTSLELALSAFCGPKDIITPLVSEAEVLRRELGYPGPQNFHLPKGTAGLLCGIILKRSSGLAVFLNHAPAGYVKWFFGDSVWDDYFKFSFERNPYDRVLSTYDEQPANSGEGSLSDYIFSKDFQLLKGRGWHAYAIGTEIVADRVFLYERLGESLKEIEARLGLSKPLELPKVNVSKRGKRLAHHEAFGIEERREIHRFFDREFDLFGYNRLPVPG